MNVGQKIINELKVQNKKKVDLAKYCGVSKQAINGWGKTGISKENLKLACEFLGKSVAWALEDKPSVSEVTSNYKANGNVPLISRVSAGNWSEASDPFEVGDAEDWLPCPAKHSPSTYALRVWGDSMTAPYGRSYPEGVIIYVDPEKDAVSGDRVIARVAGDTEVTFKQLIIEGNRRYLKALNPGWPVITDKFEIIGKVIGSYMEE